MKTKVLKTERWNFKITDATNRALRDLAEECGKNMTVTLEDLVAGRRLFRREIEAFLDSEEQRTGLPRWQIIEAALWISAQRHQANEPKTSNPNAPLPPPHGSSLPQDIAPAGHPPTAPAVSKRTADYRAKQRRGRKSK